MAHTISSRRIREITINGVSASELMLFSYACTYLGIPTAFCFPGDEAICEKAKMLESADPGLPCEKRNRGGRCRSASEKAEKMWKTPPGRRWKGIRPLWTYKLPPEFHADGVVPQAL